MRYGFLFLAIVTGCSDAEDAYQREVIKLEALQAEAEGIEERLDLYGDAEQIVAQRDRKTASLDAKVRAGVAKPEDFSDAADALKAATEHSENRAKSPQFRRLTELKAEMSVQREKVRQAKIARAE